MSATVIRIPTGAHFSFAECRWFLHRNFDDCLHEVDAIAVTKAISILEQPVLFRIAAEPQALVVTLLKGQNSAAMQTALKNYITEWFDLERDLQPFYQLLEKDKRLLYMATDFAGLRLMGIPDLFEALCWCIIGQQINLRFAYTIKRRLVEQYGGRIQHEGKVYYTFPSPATLAAADEAILRNMQLSARKAAYLLQLANAFEQGTISKAQLQQLPGFTDRQKALTAIKGIGIWTANYALMKSLKEPCVPYGDAGLLNALIRHKIIKEKNDRKGIDRFFKKFPLWESYMAFYFWRSLAVQPGGEVV